MKKRNNKFVGVDLDKYYEEEIIIDEIEEVVIETQVIKIEEIIEEQENDPDYQFDYDEYRKFNILDLDDIKRDREKKFIFIDLDKFFEEEIEIEEEIETVVIEKIILIEEEIGLTKNPEYFFDYGKYKENP